jgi:hypothetical protein
MNEMQTYLPSLAGLLVVLVGSILKSGSLGVPVSGNVFLKGSVLVWSDEHSQFRII